MSEDETGEGDWGEEETERQERNENRRWREMKG